MGTNEGIFLFIVACMIFLYLQFSYHRRQDRKRFLNKAKRSFGQIPDREYDGMEFDRISHYYRNYGEQVKDRLDDITWNDLDMDQVFLQMNHTYSSMGEEYLYFLLRTPVRDEGVLRERDRLIRYFGTHEEERLKLQLMFHSIGRMRKYSISDYVERLEDMEPKSNGKHYLMLASLAVSVGAVLVNPGIGVFLFIAAFGNSIYQYYKEKAGVEAYFVCFRQIAAMMSYVGEMERLGIDEIGEYTGKLHDAAAQLKEFKRGVGLLASGNMAGSLEDAVMDYVRILTHVDLIKFNSMLNVFHENKGAVRALMEGFGFLESMIAAASFRESLSGYCVPEFSNREEARLSIVDFYHPAVSGAVLNSITASGGVLVTGSNASGKSTFLKAVAINVILAQTVYTVLAKEYRGSLFRVMSSMALRDNLMGQESYYIVEIKSLKRIMDASSEETPLLCLIDEVLRGTNTVERIAASAQILKSLSGKKTLCFAATHDIELTHMLEGEFANYHFEEEIVGNNVLFNYELKKGRAVSRNAIRLLAMIGYPEEVIKKAEKSAEEFVKKGEWLCL